MPGTVLLRKTRFQEPFSCPDVCYTKMPAAVANASGQGNFSTAYANILLHEVFWFGVLGRLSDDLFAPSGSLGSPNASASVPTVITEQEAEQINRKMESGGDRFSWRYLEVATPVQPERAPMLRFSCVACHGSWVSIRHRQFSNGCGSLSCIRTGSRPAWANSG